MYRITVILQQYNHRYPGECTGLHLYYSDITTGTLVNALYYSYTTAL